MTLQHLLDLLAALSVCAMGSFFVIGLVLPFLYDALDRRP